MKPPAENLGTSQEVAEYLRVNPKTLSNWAHKGTGPVFVKIGTKRLYDWADVRAFVEARKVATS